MILVWYNVSVSSFIRIVQGSYESRLVEIMDRKTVLGEVGFAGLESFAS